MAERVDAKSGHWVIYVNGQVSAACALFALVSLVLLLL